jgi:hypothetical protein
MTTGELLRMLVVDALVIVGFAAGAFLLYTAIFVAPPGTQLFFSLGAIACAVVPLPLALVLHNQIVRRRLRSGDDS